MTIETKDGLTIELDEYESHQYFKRQPFGTPLLERLLYRTLILSETACWIWYGGHNSNGYGSIMDQDGNVRGTHRVAYELLVGPVPEGLHLDHLCRVRCCINPAHLEPVTQRENVLRGVGLKNALAFHKAKMHCSKGHEFTPENTYVQPKFPNRRQCRECNRLKCASWNGAKRAGD